MRRSLQRAVILSAGILALGLAPLFGWGETADRLVTNRAVDTLPQEMQPFFYANRQFLVEHVGAADEADAKNGTARHTDFIQLDHYGPFPFSALPREYNGGHHEIQPPRPGTIRNSSVGNRFLQQEAYRRISRSRLEPGAEHQRRLWRIT